jgi:hypothetical protein
MEIEGESLDDVLMSLYQMLPSTGTRNVGSRRDTSVDTNGNTVVDIFSRNSFEGELKYEGTNEIGPQMDIDLFKVAFKPGKSLNPISD